MKKEKCSFCGHMWIRRTEETPVKSKNTFNFPFTFDFKTKKINIAPNKKKRPHKAKLVDIIIILIIP